MSRDEFNRAFLLAIDRQSNLAPHTPGWKPLIDLVWEELSDRNLVAPEATALSKLSALMLKHKGMDVDICSPGNHGGSGADQNRWLITLMTPDARDIREFFGDTLEEAINYATL